MLSYQIPIGVLNINGQNLYGASRASKLQGKMDRSALKIENGDIGAVTSSKEVEEKKIGNLEKNFATSLLQQMTDANNKLDEKRKRSEEEKEALASEIVGVVAEVKEKFGSKEATRLMATVLSAVESDFTEERLVAALSTFFLGVKDSAMATLQRHEASEESLKEADRVLGELEEMIAFMNYGATDDGEGRKTNLSDAINGYFGRGEKPEEERRIFRSDFQFVSDAELAAAEEAQKAAQAKLDFIITKAELGEEAVAATAAYLAGTLASAEAAWIISELEDDADVFAAIGKIRERLSVEEGREGETAAGEAAGAGREVTEGDARKALFDDFLNTYLASQVNKLIEEKEGVRERFLSVASASLGTAVSSVTGLSLSGWPGLAGSFTAVSVSIGFEREISLTIGADSKIEASVSQSIKIGASVATGAFGGGSLVASGFYWESSRTEEKNYVEGRVTATNSRATTVGSFSLLTTVI
ncbi:MAG: hypothetical protein LBO66_13990 [Deltaproteobacteria bacterium]|jgi:hypothetical protein|nr:hypothetical protein [Deltaproteobacteria bacterium]